MKQINRYELEITSLCNAECHVCHRTKNVGKYELTSLTVDDIKNIFPRREDIEEKQFLLCGAIGDPVANKQCYEIVEYLVSNNAWVEINSNASLQTTAWWEKLGKLSATSRRVTIWFCVDGHRETNHIYRKNTDFDLIERNMEAYTAQGGIGTWMFIEFDHNEHELEIAKNHAIKLGLKFSTRRGPANKDFQVNTIKRKNKQTGEVTIEEKIVVATGNKVHSKIDQIEELRQFVQEVKNAE